MNVNDMIKLVIGVVVGILMVSAILVPTVGSALITAGDEVSYSNTINSAYPYHYDAVTEMTFTASTPDTTSTYYTEYEVNGIEISQPASGVYLPILMSDDCTITLSTGTNPIRAGVPDDSLVTRFIAPTPTNYASVEITLSNGEFKIIGIAADTTETELYSSTLTWAYSIVEDGAYITHLGSLNGVYYDPNDVNSVIVTSGTYTSAENDTYYTYYNGELGLEVADYTGYATLEGALTAGTTNIYTMSSFSITVDDGNGNVENFVPYRTLVKETVDGNKSSGGIYELLDIIPLLVTVGLIVGIVGVAFARRE